MIRSRSIIARTLLCLALAAPWLPAAEPDLPFVYVSGTASEIICFRLDAGTGTLIPASTSPGGKEPSYLAWSPDHRVVYALNAGADGSQIASFSVNPVNGALSPLRTVASGGKGATHLAVHPSGRWVYVAHYGSGHLSVLPVLPGGEAGEPVATVVAGSKAHQAVLDRAGRHLFVPCLGTDRIAIYAIDPESGALAALPPAVAPAGAGPRHLALSTDERHAYVMNELGSSVTTFAIDTGTGAWTPIQTVSSLPEGYQGKNTGAHIAVTGDGRTVYASNRGLNSIAILRTDPSTGVATLNGQENAGGEMKRPRDFTIDPSGTMALVASMDNQVLMAFRIDHSSGGLIRLATVPVAKAPTFVGVMPAP